MRCLRLHEVQLLAGRACGLTGHPFSFFAAPHSVRLADVGLLAHGLELLDFLLLLLSHYRLPLIVGFELACPLLERLHAACHILQLLSSGTLLGCSMLLHLSNIFPLPFHLLLEVALGLPGSFMGDAQLLAPTLQGP